MADASWGERNIYGILIMMNNGVIVAETKKMGPVDSSAEAEGIATSKCAEILENVREIARGMGILVPLAQLTLTAMLGTDFPPMI
jgi:hypothetical protein